MGVTHPVYFTLLVVLLTYAIVPGEMGYLLFCLDGEGDSRSSLGLSLEERLFIHTGWGSGTAGAVSSGHTSQTGE